MTEEETKSLPAEEAVSEKEISEPLLDGTEEEGEDDTEDDDDDDDSQDDD